MRDQFTSWSFLNTVTQSVAIRKKNGEQRRIIDSLPANAVFEDTDPVRVATGQSFAALEVDEGQPVCIGGVDIQVAFYTLQLPVELRRFFGLLPLRAEDTLSARSTDEHARPARW